MRQRICKAVGKHGDCPVLTRTTLMAIVMLGLLFLFIAFMLVSVASADIVGRNYTREGGWITYAGNIGKGFEDEPNKILVFEGKKIYFINETNVSNAVIVSGPYEYDGDTESGCKDYPVVEANKAWDCNEHYDYFSVKEAADRGIGGWFGADDHSFTLELEKEEVRECENFKLKMKKNNKRGGVMKLTIKDEDEFVITNVNGTYINEIPIRYNNETDFTGYDKHEGVVGISFENGMLVFNTTKLNMKEGEYTIILEDFATEVKEKVDIKIKKIFLDVELEEDEVVKGDDIVIKIKSSFYEENVNVTVGDFYSETSLPLDEDGKIKVTIPTGGEEVRYGKHKITVKVCGTTEKVTKYVTVKKGEVSLEEIPEDATVGDVVHIEGTSDFGDFAAFVIEDIFKGEARITDDEFEWDWDTDGELDGYHGIEVFIVNEHVNFSIGDHVSEDWQRKKGVDASAGIFLLLPEFRMTVSRNIAEGDDVVISGEATGTNHVYVIVFNYKGEVMFPEAGIAEATAVEDEEWEENIGELDSGRYTVIALHEGKDGITKAIKDGKWAAGGEGKTLEQRVAILEDAVSTAGSDDLFEIKDFIVSAPEVTLKVPGIVEIGDTLSVKAETNIKNGEKALVSLSQNSSIIDKTTVVVENGSVTASINTSGLQPGKYNVTVDICGKAFDEKRVMLVEKKEKEEEGKVEKKSIPQNESVPEPEAVEEANESVGEGGVEINESQEGEERKIPVNMWDLLIAVIVAIFTSIVVKRRRCYFLAI